MIVSGIRLLDEISESHFQTFSIYLQITIVSSVFQKDRKYLSKFVLCNYTMPEIHGIITHYRLFVAQFEFLKFDKFACDSHISSVLCPTDCRYMCLSIDTRKFLRKIQENLTTTVVLQQYVICKQQQNRIVMGNKKILRKFSTSRILFIQYSSQNSYSNLNPSKSFEQNSIQWEFFIRTLLSRSYD